MNNSLYVIDIDEIKFEETYFDYSSLQEFQKYSLFCF